MPATAPAAAGRSAPGIVAAPAPARGTAGLPVAARDVLPASAALDGRRWLLAGPAEASGVTAPAGRARPAAQPFVALRFRYVSTPFWWSMGTRPESLQPSAALSDVPAAGGAGAGAAAAAIWRSLLAASGPERGATPVPAVSAGRPIGGFDAFVAAVPQAGQPAGAPAYIAMSSAGAAGTVPASAAARARAQAIEMSIVAAIPPAPPPLETMGSSAGPAEAPRARRGQAQDAAHGRHKEAEDAVSHSKIEGSVDAIAQRIYHRIRRRLQSDRERFGG